VRNETIKNETTSNEVIKYFPLLTFYLYVATFQKSLHLEYLS